jgi:hypothetical protein
MKNFDLDLKILKKIDFNMQSPKEYDKYSLNKMFGLSPKNIFPKTTKHESHHMDNLACKPYNIPTSIPNGSKSSRFFQQRSKLGSFKSCMHMSA